MQVNPLREIREGMKVVDSADHEVGTVEWIRFGDDDPATPEPEAAGINPMDEESRDSLVDIFADVFRDDDLPEEVRERLLQQGFVRVDAEGLFARDRYITPDQIAGVSGDAVRLRVSRDQLFRRK